MAVDFDRIAAAALAQAERLCHEWLGGKRQGHEWVGERRINGGPGDSWSVNLTTGAWLHGAGDERGGDIISLYAALNHCEQAAAARAVGELCAVPANGHAGPAHVPAPEQSCQPIPDSDPPTHPKHGAPEALYRYGDAFVIGRYITADGKTFAQWTYRAGRWTLKSYPAQRPIFGLEELAAKPQSPVLVVEGEKCALAARAALPAYACVTWAGGAQAVKTADWTVLKSKAVIIWPDADEPGINAAATLAALLLPICSQVRVIKPNGQPPGWDIADAVAEHWTTNDLVKWAKEHIQEIPTKPQVGRPHDSVAPIEHESALVTLQSLGLERNSGGIPFPTIGNVAQILEAHPLSAGRIWYDVFRSKIMQTVDNVARPWTDADDLRSLQWLQQSLHFSKIGLQAVMHAVQLVAFNNARNSVVSWLDSLTWDEIPRLSMWLSDLLGAPNTAYTQAVAQNWLISMAARAYTPGCQADHMPVLEGASGRGKSSALAIIGGEWYRAAPQAFGSKEFLEVIQGAWLVEIPDMVGFGRREHTQIISAITTRADPFRASYGRHAEDHPRVTIFAATSETDDYLKDSRGVRRYWPVRCSEIELQALAASRDQLFAEAVVAFKSGSHWHDMPENETATEQADRQEVDVWLEPIAAFCATRDQISVTEVATYGLDIERSRQSQIEANRIVRCLKTLGYSCKVERVSGHPVRVYRR